MSNVAGAAGSKSIGDSNVATSGVAGTVPAYDADTPNAVISAPSAATFERTPPEPKRKRVTPISFLLLRTPFRTRHTKFRISRSQPSHATHPSSPRKRPVFHRTFPMLSSGADV